MTTNELQTTHVSVRLNLPTDDASSLVRHGVATYNDWTAPTSRAELLEALDAVPRDVLRRSHEEAVQWQHAAAEGEHDYNDLLKRAEAAEAKLAKVQAWRDGDEQFDKLDAILNPAPAFELPTERGAGIMARFHDTPDAFELRLFKSGWRDDFGNPYEPEQILSDLTDHRPIGADQ